MNYHPDIFEVKNISEIKQYTSRIRGRALFVWDIDNTLGCLAPEIMVGTDHWFDEHLAAKTKSLLDVDAAVAETIKIQKYIHENCQMQAVEAEVIPFIKNLQDEEQHCAIALTSRCGIDFTDLTRSQTKSLGICFDRSRLFHNTQVNLQHLGPRSAAYGGYIFAGGQDKGECLKHVMQTLGYSGAEYTDLICVDDKFDNLVSVKAAAKELNMRFTGIHYGYLDAQIAELGVDLDIAHLQYEQHRKTGKFISIASARNLLRYPQILCNC